MPGAPDTRPGFWFMGAAGFELEEEMKAAFAMRKGWRAAVGLAILVVSLLVAVVVMGGVGDIPRSAMAVACLVEENMAAIVWVCVAGSGEWCGEARELHGYEAFL